MANIYANLKKKNTNDIIYPNISPEQNIPNNSVSGNKMVDNSIPKEKLSNHLYNLHIKLTGESDDYADIFNVSLNIIHTANTLTYDELKTYLNTNGYNDTNTAYPCCGNLERQGYTAPVLGITSAVGGLFLIILDYSEDKEFKEIEIDDVTANLTINSIQLI